MFITWKGDHSPYHVHVYKQGRLVVKWDLESGRPMKGAASRRLIKIIEQLQLEGLL